MLECYGAGRLTGDPEMRYTSSGTAVVNMSIAFNSKQKNKEVVAFMECVVWGRLAEVAHQYLKKGSKILIKGDIRQESWQDRNGNNRYKYIINARSFDMLDCKEKGNNQNNYINNQPQTQTQIPQNSYHKNNTYNNQPSYEQNAYNTPKNQAPTQQQEDEYIPEIDIDEEEPPF